ncbi:hypothetical protein APR04_004611 [Promicromonospora umidemergens]|uniref:Uncharacterized protein n=1 Tax=Promicromonospora umidemergens TaxID=629679 RepID=A0ABP8XLW8_9MICO|nr:hypothetical protein [Promicromonospora umidemergens]MCP2285676.1 hypothetical protein [Promicromonospora umidemergens]
MLRHLALPVTAVFALTLSACTGGDVPDTVPSTQDPTQSVSSPAPTASDASLTPEPSSPEPEPLRAADGERYKACADGACEVIVTVGTTFALDPAVAGGMDAFEITEIDEDGAGADFDGPGQNIHAFASAGAGSFVANGLPYTVVEVQDDQAVIRLGD